MDMRNGPTISFQIDNSNNVYILRNGVLFGTVYSAGADSPSGSPALNSTGTKAAVSNAFRGEAIRFESLSDQIVIATPTVDTSIHFSGNYAGGATGIEWRLMRSSDDVEIETWADISGTFRS